MANVSIIKAVDANGTLTSYDINDASALHAANVGATNNPVYVSGNTVTECYPGYIVALGRSSNASGTYAVALGYSSNACGTYAVALGYNSNASGIQSTALGHNAKANGNYTTAIGRNANANADYATAIGHNANANADYATAIGHNVKANGNYATALGSTANASGSGAAALGYSANASGINAVALGRNAVCANANGIQLGNASYTSTLTCKVSLTTTSDIRDKTDIAEIEDGATEFLKAIKAIRYVFNGRELYIDEENLSDEDREKKDKYGLCAYDTEAWAAGTKKGSRIRVGVSAQEVQQALEDIYGDESYGNLVNDNLYDFDPDEIPDDVESQLAVNYSGFIPFIIKAIQEIDARVAALEETQA